jgi:hypothetical protein
LPTCVERVGGEAANPCILLILVVSYYQLR